MSFFCGSGASNKTDANEALSEAISVAKENGKIEKIDFALVYFTIGHSVEAIESALEKNLKDIPHSGCSGEGVIARDFAVEGENTGISVMLFSGSKVVFTNTLYENLSEHDYEIGIEISKWSKDIKKLQNIILLPDGLSCNFSRLKAGIESKFSFFHKAKLFGGLAGDDFSMQATYQIHNGKIYQNSVSVIAMSGKFKTSSRVNHGCAPVSRAHTVTRVENNIIYEIDGIPALDLISKYSYEDELTDWGKTSINLCLALEAPKEMNDSYDNYLIRFMTHRNEDEKSITISSNVEVGDSIWIARRDLDKIDTGIVEIGQGIRSELKDKEPLAVFHFDCGGRGRMIMDNERKMKNLRFLQNEVGGKSPWCGFFTFGEIAPVNNRNSFHSYTAVVMAIYS